MNVQLLKRKRVIGAAGVALMLATAVYLLAPPRTPEAKAVAVAKSEARKRGFGNVILVDGVEFKRELWVVHLNSFPFTLGGHAVVEVSPAGEVIRYLPGK